MCNELNYLHIRTVNILVINKQWPPVNSHFTVLFWRQICKQTLLPESCQTWYNGCLYLFWGYRVKGQGQTTDLWNKNAVRSIFLDPFAGKLLNLVQWMYLVSRWPILMFRSHGQRSNRWSLYKYCPLNIFWPLCLKIAKLSSVDASWEWMFPIDV